MSLRIIIKADQDPKLDQGTPRHARAPAEYRRRPSPCCLGTTESAAADKPDYEPVSIDDLLEAMRF